MPQPPALPQSAVRPRRRRLTACVAATLAAVTLSGCDVSPTVQANARQVTVVGSGEVKGVPDTLTADIGIEVIAPDANAAMNQTSQRQQAVIDMLKARGIDETDIATRAVNLQPQTGDNSAITGYRASNSITVTIRELSTAPGLLAAVVNAGGNSARINSVSYSIDDDSKLLGDARARAFEDARARAQQYADLSGLALGKIISISEAPGSDGPLPKQSPVPIPQGAMAADVPLQPGEQTVSFSVTATWELD